MARIARIVPSNLISNFHRTGLEAGQGFALVADALDELYGRFGPAAEEAMREEGRVAGLEAADRSLGEFQITYDGATAGKESFDRHVTGTPGQAEPQDWKAIQAGIFKGESGGDYTALFGYSQRPGGRFAGLDPTKMTVDEVLAFQDPRGPYGQWVKGKVGRVATPVGAYQIVGTTLREAKTALGLSGAEHFTPALQDRLGQYILATQGTGAWEGYRGPETPGVVTRGNASVTFRNQRGELEGRTFSPLSGPILRAHDLAAKATYQAEVISGAASDLAEIRQAFPMQPKRVADESQKYIDKIVASAPEGLRPLIRAELNTEARRSVLGATAEYQRETRTRASNANKAMIDRLAQEYTQAVIGGDEDEITGAQSRLDAALRVRERLPGVGWTVENSALLWSDTARKIERERTQKQNEAARQAGNDLDTVIRAAKNGLIGEKEEILNDPAVQALQPEKVKEAQAFIDFRNMVPDFLSMPPDQQAAVIQEWEERGISEPWQVDLIRAAKQMAAESQKSWDDDPIARASQVLEPAPDVMGAVASGEPDKIVAALQARKEYSERVAEGQYTTTRAFLTDDEAKQLKTVLGKETPPELRATLAGAVVGAMGTDAVRFFEEIDGDSLTMLAGKIYATVGDPDRAMEIMRGQMILDEGAVKVPTNSRFTGALPASFQTALSAAPGGLKATGDLMMAARAIYAARAVGAELDDVAANELMVESINAAMGGSTGKRGEALGGVQEIGGEPVLLPPHVSGEEVEAAIDAAMKKRGLIGRTFGNVEDPDLSAFASAAFGNVPHFQGVPIDSEVAQGATFSISPLSQSTYVLNIHIGNSSYPATTDKGTLFAFALQRFLDESQ